MPLCFWCWLGAAETLAQTHTPTPRTRARSGWVTAHPCQEWLGASGARTQAHTQPNTPARSGGVQPKPKPKLTHPHRAPVLRVAASPRTRARSGWVQAERAHEHTHSPTPQPGVAGRSQNPSPNTLTHTAHPCQEWLGHCAPVPGVAGCKRSAHTSTHPAPQPGVAGRSRNPSPNSHTHTAHQCYEWLRHRAPVPGVAGCKRSAHTSTHTAQNPSQEWRGGA